MTPSDLRASTSSRVPPAGLSAPLQALWWVEKGDWDRAHGIVQNEGSAEAAWVHAYLHRIEGDLANARYWYRQATCTPANGPLPEEWDAIAGALLGRESKT
jgi:hypothetical protein